MTKIVFLYITFLITTNLIAVFSITRQYLVMSSYIDCFTFSTSFLVYKTMLVYKDSVFLMFHIELPEICTENLCEPFFFNNFKSDLGM